MKDEFKGTRGPGFLMIPHPISRCKTFLKWVGTPDYKVWLYLQSYIIREPVYTGKVDLYKTYYENGLLAARWSVANIAEHLDYGRSNVSKILKRLEKQGIIKIDKYRAGKSGINVYILGTHDDLFNDSLYALTIFKVLKAEEDLVRKFKDTDYVK